MLFLWSSWCCQATGPSSRPPPSRAGTPCSVVAEGRGPKVDVPAAPAMPVERLCPRGLPRVCRDALGEGPALPCGSDLPGLTPCRPDPPPPPPEEASPARRLHPTRGTQNPGPGARPTASVGFVSTRVLAWPTKGRVLVGPLCKPAEVPGWDGMGGAQSVGPTAPGRGVRGPNSHTASHSTTEGAGWVLPVLDQWGPRGRGGMGEAHVAPSSPCPRALPRGVRPPEPPACPSVQHRPPPPPLALRAQLGPCSPPSTPSAPACWAALSFPQAPAEHIRPSQRGEPHFPLGRGAGVGGSGAGTEPPAGSHSDTRPGRAGCVA
ncbi:basic proline-rich protein-like [Vulpes lagopus]|uniref:basic proline-rich protein-like n=1 Tax=Vulpes lagopus TaxID=494514 RepID=UPI001BC8FB3B|nr:basic proline-rich protein-like [Vulpes lagopus]